MTQVIKADRADFGLVGTCSTRKSTSGGGNRGKEGVKTKIMFDFREACGAYV